jgi:hypothetical protein
MTLTNSCRIEALIAWWGMAVIQTLLLSAQAPSGNDAQLLNSLLINLRLVRPEWFEPGDRPMLKPRLVAALEGIKADPGGP